MGINQSSDHLPNPADNWAPRIRAFQVKDFQADLHFHFWKLNLLAASKNGLLFAATGGSIVYLNTENEFTPPIRFTNLQGTPTNQHEEINQIKIMNIGTIDCLVAVYHSGLVLVWVLHDLEKPPIRLQNVESSWSLTSTSSKAMLFIGSNAHEVICWDFLEPILRPKKMIEHNHNIPCVEVSPDDQLILSSSIDQSIRITHIDTKKEVSSLQLTNWAWTCLWIESKDVMVYVEPDQIDWLLQVYSQDLTLSNTMGLDTCHYPPAKSEDEANGSMVVDEEPDDKTSGEMDIDKSRMKLQWRLDQMDEMDSDIELVLADDDVMEDGFTDSENQSEENDYPHEAVDDDIDDENDDHGRDANQNRNQVAGVATALRGGTGENANRSKIPTETVDPSYGFTELTNHCEASSSSSIAGNSDDILFNSTSSILNQPSNSAPILSSSSSSIKQHCHQSKYLIFASTTDEVMLLSSTLKPLYRLINPKNSHVERRTTVMDRYSILSWIPEWSMLFIGNQGHGQIIIATLRFNVKKSEYQIVPEILLPHTPVPRFPLCGIAHCRRVEPSGTVKYRIFVASDTIYAFDLELAEQTPNVIPRQVSSSSA